MTVEHKTVSSMRLESLVAIAKRDLKIEFGARRGWLLPLVAAAILGPTAAAPNLPEQPRANLSVRVAGDVPDAIVQHERFELAEDQRGIFFEAPKAPDQAFLVHSKFVPTEIREHMDAEYGGIQTEVLSPRDLQFPNRSLFLALIAASILTGSISQSIPGERTNRTLESLLTAGVTRAEIVAGKWLAWGAFGGGFGLLAATVTLLLGRQTLGWWLLPLPLVSFGTVALGFFLVRRANDVIGGATVSIRVLPATLTAAGLLAWYLGGYSPYLGALVPLGGALIAAGDTWPGLGPPLLASVSTLTLSVGALAATARDIVEGERAADDRGTRAACFAAALAATAWWGAVLGPLLWVYGGNPAVTARLSEATGPLAGSLGIALLLSVKAGRAPHAAHGLGLTMPRLAQPLKALTWATLAIVVILAAHAMPSTQLVSDTSMIWQMQARLTAASHPAWGGPWLLLATVITQEALFRGWMHRQTKPEIQVMLFALVMTPLQPWLGLALGWALTRITIHASGSIVPAILVRLVAAALSVAWAA